MSGQLPSKKGCLFAGAMIAIALGMVWYFFIGPQIHHDRLVKHGVQAPGRLLDVEETGTTINDSPELELTIEFQLKDGRLDTSVCTFTPSLRSIHLYQPGTSVTAAYDAEDPDEITIVSLGGPSPTGSLPPGMLPPGTLPNDASEIVEKTKRTLDSMKQQIDSMANAMKKLHR